MDIRPSTASEADIETYTAGECHVFAVALHRLFGWQIEVITNDDEIWWEDESDSDNFIPAVVHAYAIDAFDNAWDVRGVRPASEIHKECQELYHVGSTTGDTCRGEGEISTYVGILEENGDIVDLPLSSYTHEDVEEATLIAAHALAGLPGFGVSSSHSRLSSVASITQYTDMARHALSLGETLGVPAGLLTTSVARALGNRGIPVGCYFMPSLGTDSSSPFPSRDLLSVGGPWIDAKSSHESMASFIKWLAGANPPSDVALAPRSPCPSAISGTYYNPMTVNFRGLDDEPEIVRCAGLIESALQEYQMENQTAPARVEPSRMPRY